MRKLLHGLHMYLLTTRGRKSITHDTMLERVGPIRMTRLQRVN